jgi:hypothetical protein
MTKVAQDFANMTAAEALDALVELDVAKWGEQQREASRQMHQGKSRGLRINSLVHHQCNDYGDAFDAATLKIAKKQLTADDMAELRKGG